MTKYNDIPRATMLHAEQERVTAAIDALDAGGTVSGFSIAPPPGAMPTTTMLGSISTQGSPVAPETIAAVRAWLVQRSDDIDAELAALGVTNTRRAPLEATS